MGLTATPKETKYVSNLTYFGDPVYTYSLKQGMTGWTQAGLPVVTGKKTKSKADKGKAGKGKKQG